MKDEAIMWVMEGISGAIAEAILALAELAADVFAGLHLQVTKLEVRLLR
jgi:hypothetical protein